MLLLLAPHAVRALEAVAIAPGAWMIPGVLAEASADNRGRVANIGILAGDDGAIVIDSGASRSQGEEILATAQRLAGKPVRLLINTHPHPQNVLGNGAFAARGIPILASAETRARMIERCRRCLAAATEAIGAQAMAGTEIVLPELVVVASEIREVAGRRLRLLVPGHAHSEGDLAVLDLDSGVLFSGDLAYRGQLPHLAESRIDGWLAALATLRGEPVRWLAPGRGAPGSLADLDPIVAYLGGLRQRVAAAYAKGLSLDETLDYAALPEFAAWEGYGARHGRNIQHVYFEFERADLERASIAGAGAAR